MKVLTIWQPWASLMAHGQKMIETRHWSTAHRGWVAIHAAKKWSADVREFAADMQNDGWLPAGDLPLGSIVAIGNLTHCEAADDLLERVDGLPEAESEFGCYGPGRIGWLFQSIMRLKDPVPVPGQQGLWTLPEDVTEDLRGRYAAARGIQR